MATTEPVDETIEADLLDRLKNGEKECFLELVKPYTRYVYMAAYSVLRNPQDAEEIAQETLLKALRSIDSFRRESRFKTWLITIAFNEARMQLRKQRKNLFESLDTSSHEEEEDYQPRNLTDWREIQSEALERKEVQVALEKGLALLSPEFREVIMLRDVQQLTIAETAEALNISESLVKTRLLRARLKMRDFVADARPSSRGKWFRKGQNPW